LCEISSGQKSRCPDGEDDEVVGRVHGQLARQVEPCARRAQPLPRRGALRPQPAGRAPVQPGAGQAREQGAGAGEAGLAGAFKIVDVFMKPKFWVWKNIQFSGQKSSFLCFETGFF